MSSTRYAVWHPFTAMPAAAELTSAWAHADLPFFTRGQGAWLEDEAGNRYFNVLSAANAIGLGREEVIEAVTAQYRKLSFHPIVAHGHSPAETLSDRLVRFAPPNMRMVFYANDGAGAVETALKLARQYFLVTGQPQRKQFISLNGSYHGNSYGALSVSMLGQMPLYQPILPGCRTVPAPNLYRPPIEGAPHEVARWCADQLETAILELGPDTVAAVVLEPIQGVNGCVVFPAEYFAQVRSITRKYGILVIADEVGTGLGRAGAWFASDLLPIEPDLITLSKGLGAGYFPIGATLVSDAIFNATAAMGFPHGWTSSGHPAGCAAALAVLDVVQQNGLVENAAALGSYLLTELRTRLGDHPHVGDVRGLGLMLGIEFVQDRQTKEKPSPELEKRIRAALKAEGILAYCFQGTVTLYPPLSITQAEAENLLERLCGVASRLAASEVSV